MNCPRCKSPTPDGKSYCSDCGAPLDASLIRLEVVIREQVKESVDSRFKDQKLIAYETSEEISNKIYGTAKRYAFFVGILLALIVIALGVVGIQSYSDFRKLISNAEGQIKPKIEQAKTSAELAQQQAVDAQRKANEAKTTIQTVTAQVSKQLGTATETARSVQDLSARLSVLEKKTSQQMATSSQRVDSRVAELDQKIDVATKDIAVQEKKLASTNELVQSIFSKGTTEYFDTKANSSRSVIIPVGKGAFVYMLLKSAPISQTLEIKWRVFSQPRASYFQINNNAIFFVWGDPAETLKQNPLEVTYIPDPTATAKPFTTLSVTNGHVYADGSQRLPPDPPPPQR